MEKQAKKNKLITNTKTTELTNLHINDAFVIKVSECPSAFSTAPKDQIKSQKNNIIPLTPTKTPEKCPRRQAKPKKRAQEDKSNPVQTFDLISSPVENRASWKEQEEEQDNKKDDDDDEEEEEEEEEDE
jgi:hypothetical protein